MRHKVYGKKLGRTKNTRRALFRSLVQNLILHGSIQTTEAKAKAIKGLVDKIVNQAKNKNTRSLVAAFLAKQSIEDKLVKEIIPQLNQRKSGYCSVVKLNPRKGDAAPLVKMSLIMDVVQTGPKTVKKAEPKKASKKKD